MALIKHAQADRIARDAIVLNLGDIQRQGTALLAQAREQAEQIVENARAERERIVSGAAEAGRIAGIARGLEEGRAQGTREAHAEALVARRAEIDRLVGAWNGALAEFGKRRDDMVQAAEREVIALACLIAGKVVKRTVTLDPSLVIEQTRAVLATVVRASELSIAVHPADRPLVEEALAGLLAQFPVVRSVGVTEDAGLARGSCVARTREPTGSGLGGAIAAGGLGGEIDASINTQLDRIVETLIPRMDAERGDERRDPAA